MSSGCRHRVITIAALVLLPLREAAAAHLVSTWNANEVGNWSDPTKWSSNPLFPNNGGSDTFGAIVDSIHAQVTLDVPILINGFNLSAGTLLGGQSLSLGTGSWLGGALHGTGTINIANLLEIDSTEHLFSGFTINAVSTATTVWRGGAIQATAGEGGVFNNLGSFDDQTDEGWFWGTTQAPVFNNSGTFTKSVGSTGVAKGFWPVYNNAGLVDIQSGGVWFAGGGHHTGSMNVGAGAQAVFSDFAELFGGAGATTTTFAATSVLDSPGMVSFSNLFGNASTVFAGTYDSAYTVVDPGPLGQVHFDAGALVNTNTIGDLEMYSGRLLLETGQLGGVSFNNMSLSGGSIDGSDETYVFGDMDWTGGAIAGTGLQTFEVFGNLTISGIEPKSINTRAFYNVAAGTSSGASMQLFESDVINSFGAIWTLDDDTSFVGDAGVFFISRFFNDGTLIKAGGGGVSSFDLVEFNNTGTVLISSGTLRLGGGGSSTGSFEIAAGMELDVSGGSFAGLPTTHNFDPATLISGAGGSRLRFSGLGEKYFAGSAQIGELHVDEGWLSVSGTIDAVNGFFGGVAGLESQTTIDAGLVELTSYVQIGSMGEASLLVANGGVLSNTIGDMAVFTPASRGTVRVEGVNSRWTNLDFLRIGAQGQATLSIADFGSVTTTTAAIVADGTTSTGRLLLSNFAAFTSVDFLEVGRAGAGTMQILSGSVVTSDEGLSATSAGSTGDVLVDGANSRWNTVGFMSVALLGSATMTIQNGGRVTTGGSGFVSNLPGSQGVVHVATGGDWDLEQQLVVGVDGSGLLTITAGGAVTTKKGSSATGSSGIIGRRGSGVGTVIIDGEGSQWLNLDGAFNVGFGSLTTADTPGGTGHLSVLNGGLLNATDMFIGRLPGGVGVASFGGASTFGTAARLTLVDSLNLGGDAVAATPTASGTLIVNAGASIVVPLHTRVWNNGRINYNGGVLYTGALSLVGGGDVILSPGGDKVLRTLAISTDASNGSVLDLADNKAIVDYTGASPADSIRQQIRSGYNTGAWNGSGITSSTASGDSSKALGYADNSALGLPSFGGVAVDATSVLIKYTWSGDSNLDGQVDISDLGNLATNWQSSGLWIDGDSNYDGFIDITDLGKLATNWQAGVGSPLGASFDEVLASLGLPGANVPEPATGACIAIGSAVLLSRRRW